MIGWLYVNAILYWAGAALTDEELEECKGGGDRWTYWFRRQKKRMDKVHKSIWIAIVALSLISMITVLVVRARQKRWLWVSFLVALLLFCTIYLIPHILGYC